jgi:alpha-D-xyloside xylohydrolase
MIRTLADQGFRVNLWEHAFTHPTSPIYESLLPLSGDYEVWDGLVPDFLLPAAQKVFSDFHEQEHVAIGVSGYKLDECDNSDFTRNWSFPEMSRFPSGADGEQMHSFFGRRYQETIQSIFDRRDQPTYGLARSSHALASPYPYVLYSDLYDHRDFIRALVNSGFSGLLWCPEVRDARDAEDLIRRLQTVVFSPLAMVNAWYIKDPPWKQYGTAVEDQCRAIIEWRMKLIPDLETAFNRYQGQGIPPFRALVLDYPDDPATWAIDNQYMMGENMMIAPVVHGEHERDVYLPEGEWTDFFTGEQLSGKRSIRVFVPLTRFPVYRKANA